MAFTSLTNFFNNITRRKLYSHESYSRENNSKLSAVLSTFDLVNLGVGSILGAGIYVVLGEVIWIKTGPASILSFLIAAFASLLAGLCYAEFGSRVPKTTGSAYAYSYFTIGELFAFIIGWNLILEYIIGTAADARALSGAIDHLTGNYISNLTRNTFGVFPFFELEYDILACILSLLITIILAIGVKESARCTTIFNFINIGIAIFIIISSATQVNPSLWKKTSKSFAPTGFGGILAGAATCFYAFVGFDIVATTGEEAISPSRSIPIAISLTLIVCLILYIGCEIVLSMLVSFRDPRIIKSNSYITEAFYMTAGLNSAAPIIGLGAIAGLASSLIGSQFPLPRIVYAMAKDGLLFECFHTVCVKTETPLWATLIPGFITCVFSAIFDLSSLVEMMSSGTLLAYSLVCTSVLILHYQKPLSNNQSSNDELLNVQQDSNDTLNINCCTLLFWICSFLLGLLLVINDGSIFKVDNYGLFLIISLLLIDLILVIIISREKKDLPTLKGLYFTVPLVPITPALAIFIHAFLMCQLSRLTWIRFLAWNAVGLVIYFGYGINNAQVSTKKKVSKKRRCLSEDSIEMLLLTSEDVMQQESSF